MIGSVCASFVLLSAACDCEGALGGAPEQFGAQGATAISNVSSGAASYVLRDTTLASGTRVREYVSNAGVVFAVSWEGPVLPDMKALLGNYFEGMVAESAKQPRAGRASLSVNLPDVVINSGGHMRALEGNAWLPNQLPAGFTGNDVQ